MNKPSASINVDWPIWYDPSSPLGSAVRHIASLSAKIHWVHLDIISGKSLKKGPRIGDPNHSPMPESVKQFTINTRKGVKLGQLRIGCTLLKTDELEKSGESRESGRESGNDPLILTVQNVIDELVAFWPTPSKKKA